MPVNEIYGVSVTAAGALFLMVALFLGVSVIKRIRQRSSNTSPTAIIALSAQISVAALIVAVVMLWVGLRTFFLGA